MADNPGIQAHIQVGGEDYWVTRAVIEEALDAVPSLEVNIERDTALPKPVSLLQAEAHFSIASKGGTEKTRAFNGVVVSAERRADADGHPFMTLVVKPKLYKLDKRTDCRTFQKKKVSEIAKQVIEGAGAEPVRLALSATYEPRDYVVQYRETDLAFLLRICAEDGIALAFDHVASQIVLFDDPKGLSDAADAKMKYGAEFGFERRLGTVVDIALSHRIQPDKVMVRDYDSKRPRFKLETTVVGKDSGSHDLEIYVYPARSAKDAEVKRRAQVLLDSFQCRRHSVTGSTTSIDLAVGERFTLEEHPYAPIASELLVTKMHVEIETSRSTFREGHQRLEARFEAIPTATSDYRPARRAPHAVSCIQTAITTGPAGEEIHVDADGCVSIQYPWDRLGKKDDHSSLPIRTLQLATGGSVLLPRVGWEVMVHCTDGDQDLPLVTGRLYNAEKPPPYPLPANKARSSIQTATTPGGGSTNEIRTDDTAGSEEMFFNASKDASVMVKNNATESIKSNATLTIGANQEINVTNSLDLTIGGSQSVSVGADQNVNVETMRVDQCGGAHSLSVGGNRDMKVGGDHKHTVGGAESVDVGSMKTDLVVGSIAEHAGGSMTLDVGAVRATLTAGNHTTTIGADHAETVGAARINLVFGNKSSDITGSQSIKIGGGQINLVTGDRNESAGTTLTDLAAGAQMIKADNVVFDADAALTVVMGASILSLTPASVTIVGISVKLDGATAGTAALVLDN